MQLDAEAKERIRRSYYIDSKSMRRIAEEEGYSRPTIEKAITNQLHNPYRLRRPKSGQLQRRSKQGREKDDLFARIGKTEQDTKGEG